MKPRGKLKILYRFIANNPGALAMGIFYHMSPGYNAVPNLRRGLHKLKDAGLIDDVEHRWYTVHYLTRKERFAAFVVSVSVDEVQKALRARR